MEFTAKQLAEILGGTVEGNENEKVHKLAKIEEGDKGGLSFLANPKYTPYIYDTNASVVIVGNDFTAEREVKCTLVRVENAYASFAKLLEIYNEIKQKKSGISKMASIAESAKIGKNVYIGDFVVIEEHAVIGDNCKLYAHCFIGENTKVGNNCTLYAGVKVYSDNVIGNDCTFHAGVVIGSDGFGFAPQSDESYAKVAQIGNVIIEDRVEIGANTVIDRATMGSTIIRRGVKLDNLIQIAHNVEIGENTVIAAQAGVSGSTKVGKNCMFGGQVGIAGHIEIGDNVKLAAQSGIGSKVKNDSVLMGSPAFDISQYKKSFVYFKNLTRLSDKINALEKEIKQLKNS